MELVNAQCAGLDVHKKTVVVGVRIAGSNRKAHKETRTFSTMTYDLLALADWLRASGVTHVAMESTGEYWKPVFALLEGQFTVLVVNAQHIKQVPGRKTDVKDVFDRINGSPALSIPLANPLPAGGRDPKRRKRVPSAIITPTLMTEVPFLSTEVDDVAQRRIVLGDSRRHSPDRQSSVPEGQSLPAAPGYLWHALRERGLPTPVLAYRPTRRRSRPARPDHHPPVYRAALRCPGGRRRAQPH